MSDELTDASIRILQIIDLSLQSISAEERVEVFDALLNIYCLECGKTEDEHEHPEAEDYDPGKSN